MSLFDSPNQSMKNFRQKYKFYQRMKFNNPNRNVTVFILLIIWRLKGYQKVFRTDRNYRLSSKIYHLWILFKLL